MYKVNPVRVALPVRETEQTTNRKDLRQRASKKASSILETQTIRRGAAVGRQGAMGPNTGVNKT